MPGHPKLGDQASSVNTAFKVSTGLLLMEELLNSPFYSDSCLIKPNVRNVQSCRAHPWQIFSNGIMLLSQHVIQRQKICQMWYVLGGMEKKNKNIVILL